MRNPYGYLSLIDYPALVVSTLTLFPLHFLPHLGLLMYIMSACTLYLSGLFNPFDTQVFSILLVLYIILGFVWLSMLACYYKDLVQLQVCLSVCLSVYMAD